jgi:serine/alanine adding enzyme
MRSNIHWELSSSFKDSSTLDKFLEDQQSYSFFQSTAYTALYNDNEVSTMNISGIIENQIVASCNILLLREKVGIFSGLTSRALIIGGPIAMNDSIYDEILGQVINQLRDKVIYLQIRNIFPLSTQKKNILKKHGISYSSHYTILNEIVSSPINSYHAGRRKNVRRSIKYKLQFKRLIEKNELALAGKLVKNTYKRILLPCPSVSFFTSTYPYALKNNLFVFGVFHEEKIIASRFCLLNGEVLYDWYAGHDSEFNHLFPNDFIVHGILEWAYENNFKLFDFGGAGNDQSAYGVREFKLKFGGKLVENGRNEIVFSPIKYKLGFIGFKLLRLIKK